MANFNQTAAVIEVRIRDLAQLFNSLDPAPFHERDLDRDAEDYIVSWARELPHDAPLQISVHLPAQEAIKAEHSGLSLALSHYFDERAAAFDANSGKTFATAGTICELVCRSSLSALLAIRLFKWSWERDRSRGRSKRAFSL